ncbi:outer membrane beta-barrel protein [Uliginosibacterium aquaticum]|uniref:Outer membrane beta-barrel protein n=1 Tax=Uliginosibacterium aquaticum TaxID=2731212 RepID=A0ABX2IC38_9RHOO|nr:outer membrane beta-barrel protein [Uliginosibacterium aquaticum]NSL54044.1 outer membrane beta-barrel protein [Uliginosibacterium aquaticum]
MKHKQLHLVVTSLFALGATGVWAAGEADTIPASSRAVPNSANVLPGNVFESGGVPVAAGRSQQALKVADGVNVYADAQASTGYDSNVTMAGKGSEPGSAFYRIRPTVTAETRYREDRYTLGYKGDFVRYPNYTPNSLGQNDLIFQAQNVFSSRAAIAWGASGGDHYDPIGSTDRSIGNQTADHYRSKAVSATFRYGAEEAIGRVEMDAGWGAKRYQNNRATTESADVDNTNVGARFYYRVMPKTRLIAEYRRTYFDYTNDTNLLSNDDTRYLLGLSWDASAAVTGTIKAGQQQKNFDTSIRQDYLGPTWEASVRWKPLSYSSFDLIGGRSANDPDGFTGVPIAKSVSLGWNHDWKSYLHSKLSAGKLDTNYRNTNRKDDEYVYSAALMYDVRRWLGVGLEYTFSHRDSTVDTYDYVRRLSMLKVEASF